LSGRREKKNDVRSAAPTMSDVARLAGVSAMTVSRALRDGASIAQETRDKIRSAVEELGYVLDQSAGSLSSKRSGFVAALIPSINNSNFADTARRLTDALEGSGLQLLLGYTDLSMLSITFGDDRSVTFNAGVVSLK
jgi:LacI family transcriptional regulator, gluconate utilization system Gnt-I transcriptional repressor